MSFPRTRPATSSCARASKRPASLRASPSVMPPATPTAGPNGACGRSAARRSTTRTMWRSIRPRRSPPSNTPSSSMRPISTACCHGSIRATTRRSSPTRSALTLNGISIYTVAKNSPDPALKAIAADMDHANMPIGPVGTADRAAEHPQHLRLQLHQIPERGARISALHVGEAAGRLLGDPVERLYGPAIAGLERQSDLDGRSKGDAVPRRSETMRSMTAIPARSETASAATMGDFVVVDMFAEACTGNKSPKAAAQTPPSR